MRPARTPWPEANDYLGELETRLARWRWSRRALLSELADGLIDAVEHYQACQLPTSRAVARALRDTGPAAVVAAAMTETLAATSARRTACTLLVTGPLIGILWLHFLVPGQPPTALLARQPVVGLLIAVSASCSALTVRIVSHPSHLSRCGRPARWGPTRTVAAACATAALGDALLLTIGLDAMATGRATLIAAAAVTTSLLRLILSQKAARRDLVR